jgi:predicted nucleic acid-binding protein
MSGMLCTDVPFFPLGLADVIIAATGLTHHLTLVTYNTNRYPMSDLQILSPTK